MKIINFWNDFSNDFSGVLFVYNFCHIEANRRHTCVDRSGRRVCVLSKLYIFCQWMYIRANRMAYCPARVPSSVTSVETFADTCTHIRANRSYTSFPNDCYLCDIGVSVWSERLYRNRREDSSGYVRSNGCPYGCRDWLWFCSDIHKQNRQLNSYSCVDSVGLKWNTCIDIRSDRKRYS